jgi:hypothetical protein
MDGVERVLFSMGVFMVVQKKKRVVRSKKRSNRGIKRKMGTRRRPKRAVASKIAILKEAGLIGCLTGTGVTSTNYKDFLYKE